MKNITLLLAVLFSTTTFASEIKGTVKKFSGMTVETRKPYSYFALQTVKGERIRLPVWMKAEIIAENASNRVSLEADIEASYCTDMSAACISGTLNNVKSAKIVFNNVPDKNLETYSSRLEKFTGMAVESPRAYSYIAIVDSLKIAVPSFLDAKILFAKKAVVSARGLLVMMSCSDMSDACGPLNLAPLKSVEIRF